MLSLSLSLFVYLTKIEQAVEFNAYSPEFPDITYPFNTVDETS